MNRRVIKHTTRQMHREVHGTCQDLKETEISTKEFYMVRSKLFKFHGLESIGFAKLKTKTSQRTDLCKYKIDTGSDGS